MRTSHVSFRAIGFYVITLSMMVLLFGLSIRLGTYTLSLEEIWAAFQPDNKNYFTLMEYRLPPCGISDFIGWSFSHFRCVSAKRSAQSTCLSRYFRD